MRDVNLYDPAKPRQMYVGVTMSLGQPTSLRELPPPPPRTPSRPPLPLTAADAPPATIVVPAVNRRADLEYCLESIAAQTYPNTQAIIVNDSAEAVDDIVARFPFARLLNVETNGGRARGVMAGLGTIGDGFVQVLSDDAVLYPDHLELLVSALLHSGASVAQSNTLLHYRDHLADGSSLTTGFNATAFAGTFTPSEALSAAADHGYALLWRRSAFEEIAGSPEDAILAAAGQYAFAYVDQITAEWRIYASERSGKPAVAAPTLRLMRSNPA